MRYILREPWKKEGKTFFALLFTSFSSVLIFTFFLNQQKKRDHGGFEVHCLEEEKYTVTSVERLQYYARKVVVYTFCPPECRLAFLFCLRTLGLKVPKFLKMKILEGVSTDLVFVDGERVMQIIDNKLVNQQFIKTEGELEAIFVDKRMIVSSGEEICLVDESGNINQSVKTKIEFEKDSHFVIKDPKNQESPIFVQFNHVFYFLSFLQFDGTVLLSKQVPFTVFSKIDDEIMLAETNSKEIFFLKIMEQDSKIVLEKRKVDLSSSVTSSGSNEKGNFFIQTEDRKVHLFEMERN